LTMTNPTSSIGARIRQVVRLNFLYPWTLVVVPWLILAAIFLVNLVLEGILQTEGIARVSASFSTEPFLIVYLFISANALLYQQFPLAISYGLSRRDFYLGVLTSYSIIALLTATGSTLIALVRGTLQSFEPSAMGGYFALVFWAYLAVQILGAAINAIYMRWRGIGLFTFLAAASVLMISLALNFGQYGLWDAVYRLLFSTDYAATRVSVQLGFLLIVALSGYVLIRRAKP